MPWCENCREEYEDGVSVCADCGAQFVGELSLSERNRERVDAALSIREEKQTPPSVREVLLTEVADEVTLAYLLSLLDEVGIPYRLMRGGAGEYVEMFTGHADTNVRIYVDEKHLGEAGEIVSSLQSEIEESKETPESLPDKDYVGRRVGKGVIWLYLALAFIIPLLFVLIASFIW